MYIKRTFTQDTHCQTVKTITNTLEETKRLYLLHRFWRHSILALFSYQKLCNFLGKGSSYVKIQMLIMPDTSTQFPFLSLKSICLCVCPWCMCLRVGVESVKYSLAPLSTPHTPQCICLLGQSASWQGHNLLCPAGIKSCLGFSTGSLSKPPKGLQEI